MSFHSARSLAFLLVGLTASAAGLSARADTLTGSTVNGSLSVNAASGATFVQGYNSPITIGTGTSSFSGYFTAPPMDQQLFVQSTFSESGLQIQILSPLSYANYTAFSNDLYSVVFSDTAFTGSFGAGTFSCAADPFGTCSITGNGLVSQSMSNGTLALNFSNAAAGQVYNFAYTPLAAIAATPEPSSLMLAGTAMLGLAGAVRRRLAS